MKTKNLIWLLVFAVFIYGCSHAAQTTSAPPEQIEPTGNVVEITVDGGEFWFNPKIIEAKKGDTVKITFKNTGRVIHNLVIPSLGVGTRVIQAGSTDSIEFIATKSGAIGIECTVPGHKERGMIGTLTVS